MPGVKKHVFHPRQSDDLFVVVIEVTEGTDEAELMNFLNSTNPVETNVQIAEEGWWYGRFDKEEEYQKQLA
ncbi:hypothetical protein D3C79_1098480 [compost metagenome]